jgi:hypothetical protein
MLGLLLFGWVMEPKIPQCVIASGRAIRGRATVVGGRPLAWDSKELAALTAYAGEVPG